MPDDIRHLPIRPEALALLSQQEIARLAAWRWIYELESLGFSTAQARRLVVERIRRQRAA